MFSISNNLKTQKSLLARYLRILKHLNTSKHYKKYSYYYIYRLYCRVRLLWQNGKNKKFSKGNQYLFK